VFAEQSDVVLRHVHVAQHARIVDVDVEDAAGVRTQDRFGAETIGNISGLVDGRARG